MRWLIIGFILMSATSCSYKNNYVGYIATSDLQLSEIVKLMNYEEVNKKYKRFEPLIKDSSIFFSDKKLPHYVFIGLNKQKGIYYLNYIKYDFHTLSRSYNFKVLEENALHVESDKSNIDLIYEVGIRNTYLCIRTAPKSFIVFVFYLGEFKEKHYIEI